MNSCSQENGSEADLFLPRHYMWMTNVLSYDSYHKLQLKNKNKENKTKNKQNNNNKTKNGDPFQKKRVGKKEPKPIAREDVNLLLSNTPCVWT